MQTGINLSRSTVRTFKHNDMDDLERVLQVLRRDSESKAWALMRVVPPMVSRLCFCFFLSSGGWVQT